jgi:hypothetical protein
VLPHPEAVAPDVDDVTVVQEPIDQGGRHDFVSKDLAPLLKALATGQHDGRMLIAAARELLFALRILIASPIPSLESPEGFPTPPISRSRL